MLESYIVTLHQGESLDDFYNDMETPGGALYIPDRMVDVKMRRPKSQNTHYMLDESEADELKNDPRVAGVTLQSEIDNLIIEPAGYFIDNGDFDKNPFTVSNTKLNWGHLRHTEELNRVGWGYPADPGIIPSTIADVTITASGKNVDVLVVDGLIDPTHPEFQKNANGTGGTRVVQFDWYSLAPGLGLTVETNPEFFGGPFQYATITTPTRDSSYGIDHGHHVGSTAAGSTFGWAPEANVYNVHTIYGNAASDIPTSLLWDFILEWHTTKPINPETGRRNPTVTTNSYGNHFLHGVREGVSLSGGWPKSIGWRGVDFTPGRDLTRQELFDRGCSTRQVYQDPTIDISNHWVKSPYFSSALETDLGAAMDAGIIITSASMNENMTKVIDGDVDWDNWFAPQIAPTEGQKFRFMRRGNTAETRNDGRDISCGALSYYPYEFKADFSNTGSATDIFAAGQAITGATKLAGTTDNRGNGKIEKKQGTSMACPQVAGVLALLLEVNPSMTMIEAKQWMLENASNDQMSTVAIDDQNGVANNFNLRSGPNKLLQWKNFRPETGALYPRENLKARPLKDGSGSNTSLIAYPRRAIRRRG